MNKPGTADSLVTALRPPASFAAPGLRQILLCFLCLLIIPSSVCTPQAGAEALTEADLGPASTTLLPAQFEGVGVEEHTGDSLPLGTTFYDDTGKLVSLGELCDGQRPVILSLNYSNCPMLCNLQLTGLVRSLQQVDWSAGREFQVVSISVDPLESHDRAAETKQRYLREYGRPGTGAGWHFLTGKLDSIATVARAVGFQYKYDRARREYSHPAVFVMVTPTGKISHYVYGVEFPPRTLRLQLVEASEGTIGTSFDRFMLFCFHYDAQAGRYSVQARSIMSIGGAVAVVVLAGFVIWLKFRERALGLTGTVVGLSGNRSPSLTELPQTKTSTSPTNSAVLTTAILMTSTLLAANQPVFEHESTPAQAGPRLSVGPIQ